MCMYLEAEMRLPQRATELGRGGGGGCRRGVEWGLRSGVGWGGVGSVEVGPCGLDLCRNIGTPHNL